MKSAGFLLFAATLTLLQPVNCDISNGEVQSLDQSEPKDFIHDGLIVLKDALTSDKNQRDRAWLEEICKLLQVVGHVCGHKDLDAVHNELMEQFAATKKVLVQNNKSEVDDQYAYKAVIYDTITNLETVFLLHARNVSLKSGWLEQVCSLLQMINKLCGNV